MIERRDTLENAHEEPIDAGHIHEEKSVERIVLDENSIDDLPEEIREDYDGILPDEIVEEPESFPDEVNGDADGTDDNSDGDVQSSTSELSEEEKEQLIQDFIEGKVEFEEVKEILAEYYASAVNSNRSWSWNSDVPGGYALSAGQKKKVIELAREMGLVPTVPVSEKDGRFYADFSDFAVFELVLEMGDWKKTDSEQFAICNQALKEAVENDPELAAKFTPEQLEQIKNGETPTGFTWHHSEKDGTMQLVPFGVHNSTNHSGGRSEGNWADAPRQ